jgi:hypothetical protein
VSANVISLPHKANIRRNHENVKDILQFHINKGRGSESESIMYVFVHVREIYCMAVVLVAMNV